MKDLDKKTKEDIEKMILERNEKAQQIRFGKISGKGSLKDLKVLKKEIAVLKTFLTKASKA